MTNLEKNADNGQAIVVFDCFFETAVRHLIVHKMKLQYANCVRILFLAVRNPTGTGVHKQCKYVRRF